MKTALLALGALALFSHLPAVAQEAAPKTRAEVRSEAASAVKSGTIVKGEGTQAAPPFHQVGAPVARRCEVKARERGSVAQCPRPAAAIASVLPVAAGVEKPMRCRLTPSSAAAFASALAQLGVRRAAARALAGSTDGSDDGSATATGTETALLPDIGALTANGRCAPDQIVAHTSTASVSVLVATGTSGRGSVEKLSMWGSIRRLRDALKRPASHAWGGPPFIRGGSLTLIHVFA